MISLRALAALVEEHGDDLDHAVAPFQVGGRSLDTDAEPALMGIVNLSRDSCYRESVANSRSCHGLSKPKAFSISFTTAGSSPRAPR